MIRQTQACNIKFSKIEYQLFCFLKECFGVFFLEIKMFFNIGRIMVRTKPKPCVWKSRINSENEMPIAIS